MSRRARAGERFVVGHHGIRVLPLERTRESQPFEFMASAVCVGEAQGADHPRGGASAAPGAATRASSRSPWSARRWCTPGRRRSSRASSRPATSACCSAATPWPRTTSSRPVRHLAGHRHEVGHAGSRRPRASPARHQHDPALRRHRGRRRAGRADRRPHAHARQDPNTVRTCRVDPRRRAACPRSSPT